MKRYLSIAAGCLFVMGAAGICLATDPNQPQTRPGHSQMGQPQTQMGQQPQSGAQSQQQSGQGQSSAASSSGAQGAQPAVVLGEVVPLEGKVTKIDKQNRTVTIQGPRGRSMTIKADSQAQHFDELKVGDQIRGRFFQGVVIGIGKSSAPVEGMENVTVQSGSSQSPSEVRMATFTMQAKVDSVDPSKHTVTLTGPEGRSETFHVSQDVDLSQLKPGQTINARYILGVALELQQRQSQQQQSQPQQQQSQPQQQQPQQQ